MGLDPVVIPIQKYVCRRFLHFTFNILFVLSIFTCRKEYILSLGNMPLMMVLIFWCLLVKVLAIFMIPTAISSGWFWSTLFVPQCMIKSDVVCCTEISRALHKTFSTWTPLIPKLRASLKYFCIFSNLLQSSHQL